MSDLDSVGDPNHVCDDACLPYVPVADRDLEDLEESAHIDALYDLLNLTHEHAALLILAVARSGVQILFPARAVAVLLDLDEEELEAALGPNERYPATDVVDYAIEAEGEDGYIGRALGALFRQELTSLGPDEEGGTG